MKRLIAIFLLGFLLSCTFPYTRALAAELKAVEKLSEIEILRLKEATEAASEANRKLQQVRDEIAKNHKMSGESWMEWQSWYEIDGDFILYYFQSNMHIQNLIIR